MNEPHPCEDHRLKIVAKSYSNGKAWWIFCRRCKKPIGLMRPLKVKAQAQEREG